MLATGKYRVCAAMAGGAVHPWPAEASRGEFINDTVLAVRELLTYFPRVLIVHLGSQPPAALAQAFPATNYIMRVLTLSFHRQLDSVPADDRVYGLQSPLTETLISVPLRRGARDETLLSALEAVLSRTEAIFAPSAIVFVGGTDVLAGDALSTFNCTIGGYIAFVDTILRTGIPMLFLGGAGWKFRLEPRAHALALMRCAGQALPAVLPPTAFYEVIGEEPNSQPTTQDETNSETGLSLVVEAAYTALALLAGALRGDTLIQLIEEGEAAAGELKRS